MSNPSYSVRQMPQTDAPSRTHWVSEKRARTLSLTEDCWQILGAMAQSIGNRSEVVEIIVRNALESDTDLAAARDGMIAKPGNSIDSGESTKPVEVDASGVDACSFIPADACGLKPEVDFDTPIAASNCSI